MKIGDKVFVPSMVNGCGIDLPAIVCNVKKALGKTRVFVRYVQPDPFGRKGGIYSSCHLRFRF